MKKFYIIIALLVVIVIAAIIIKSKSSGNGNGTGTGSQFDMTKGDWTQAQREKALMKLTGDWFPHIISKNWNCVKDKDAVKLTNDAIYQIWLGVKNAGKNTLAFPVDAEKGYGDLLENMKMNGVYDIALADAKAKLA